MPSATLTSKGQLTLPKKIREHLGLHPGDRLNFQILENNQVLLEPETADPLSLIGVLKPHKIRHLSLAQMETIIQTRGRQQ